ncbi:hypothetical protein [Streptomyces sp. NPDC001966]
MTTSRNEETAAASEPEAHATSEAATGETSVRAARAASAGGGGTAGAAEPSGATSAGTSAGTPAGTSEAAAEPGRKHEQEEETASGAATAATTTAEGETATATAEADAESDAEAEATATMTATTTADAPERTGRPNKALLAGAAIAGVLLVTVPFLVHAGGGDDGKRSAGGGEAPGTLLGSGTGDIPGAFASAAPSPRKPNGKQTPGGKDGGAASPDGAHGSTPLNEGGGSTGGTTGDGDGSAQKSDGGTKTTAGKSTTNRTGTGTGTGSAAGGTAGGSGGTTEKTTPQSTVVYTGVAGPGCPTPAGGGYQQDGYFSDGSAGWYTRPSGGWSGNGCNGRYVSVPMSGDTGVDAKSRVKWWWKPGTAARTCQISVYIPNVSNSLYVGGHPTKYHVLVNANDRTSMYSSFTINQVAHRGQWVDAGTFALKGSTIGVKLLDRGDDWSKGWEKAHHAAAQIKVTCRS